MSDATAPPLRRSTWTRKEKIIRVIWETAARVIWRMFPGSRSRLIRLFGGVVGSDCVFASNANITIPWNLTIGDRVRVGEWVDLYSLGMITIGSGAVIDMKAHLCAGSHDFTDMRFPLTRPTITVGSDTLIGIDAYIGPGVSIGDRCVVHPRASVYKDVQSDTEVIGNPARVVEPSPDGAT